MSKIVVNGNWYKCLIVNEDEFKEALRRLTKDEFWDLIMLSIMFERWYEYSVLLCGTDECEKNRLRERLNFVKKILDRLKVKYEEIDCPEKRDELLDLRYVFFERCLDSERWLNECYRALREGFEWFLSG